MTGLQNAFAAITEKIVSIKSQGRLMLSLLVLAGIAAAIYGIYGLGADNMTCLLDGSTTQKNLTTTQNLLQTHGLRCEIRQGKLLVDEGSLQQARLIMSGDSSLRQEAMERLQKAAAGDDIWTTQAQSDKKWQAAKMASLGQLIQTLPQIRSASVLFDPGAGNSLGGGAEATASVMVEAEGCLSPTLVNAIVDTVTGSIAGISPENVRIVDTRGRSYHVDNAADAHSQVRLAEAYYVERIQLGLKAVGDLLIAVNVNKSSPWESPDSVAVSVPRSYMENVCKAQGVSDSANPKDKEVMIAAQIAKLRTMILELALCKNAAGVKIDWYYDSPKAAATFASGGEVAGSKSAGLNSPLWAAIALGTAMLAAIIFRKPKTSPTADTIVQQNGIAEENDQLSEIAPATQTDEEFGFLETADTEKVLSALKTEHPQAIALVLSRLTPARAAAILSRLPEQTQSEVGRCVADMKDVDESVIGELHRILKARLEQEALVPANPGQATITRILQHVPYDTESKVLEGISDSSPQLAQSIRREMFTFDNILGVPVGVLGDALKAAADEDIAIALFGTSRQITKKLLSSMSGRQESNVRRAMAAGRPVRLSEVEAAQQRIMDVIRRSGGSQYVSTETAVESQSQVEQA